MTIQDNADYYKYLFDLQQSGRTNMLGAVPFLEDAFELDKNAAKSILLYWMENYELIAKELGVDI